MSTQPGTTRRRTREEVAQDFARLVASAEQKLVLMQHAAHNALRAFTPEEVRHWVRQTEVAQRLLVDASIDVSDGYEALVRLYPVAHDDSPHRYPGGGTRCACGRSSLRCSARIAARDGYTQWVDEHGGIHDISEAATEAIPAGQR